MQKVRFAKVACAAMSMLMSLVALRDEDIERIHADPLLVWLAVDPYNPETYELKRAEANKKLFVRLFGKKAPAETPTFEILGGCELNKAWNGVHYLFTGSSYVGEFPLDFLVRYSRCVGKVDVGYGPARTYSSKEMQQIHEAMKPFTDEVLASRYNPADMMRQEVYPEVWDGEDEPENREWVVDAAKDLRSFVAGWAEKGCGCLISIT